MANRLPNQLGHLPPPRNNLVLPDTRGGGGGGERDGEVRLGKEKGGDETDRDEGEGDRQIDRI